MKNLDLSSVKQYFDVSKFKKCEKLKKSEQISILINFYFYFEVLRSNTQIINGAESFNLLKKSLTGINLGIIGPDLMREPDFFNVQPKLFHHSIINLTYLITMCEVILTIFNLL